MGLIHSRIKALIRKTCKTYKISEFAPEDVISHTPELEYVISHMPDDVITNILERLPLQDVVRTGILSRSWRFKWTMLSQLIFDGNFFAYLLETDSENDYGNIINNLIHGCKGAITKFVLYLEQQSYRVMDDEDINNWILFLSRNGIKDLTFYKENGPRLKLPPHLFSCLELKHLKLFSCYFDPPVSFHGFPNLLSLELRCVEFESGKFVEFFNQCPVLENLKFSYTFPAGNVKLDEIAKLTNLKMLYLVLFSFDNTTITSSSSILEMVGFLPKLQELHLDFMKFKFTEGGDTEKSFPTSFPCIRTLKLSRIDLRNGITLSCVIKLINSLQNLQTLEIIASYWDPAPGNCSLEVDYHTMESLQLQSVVFRDFKGADNEACLVKYLLACSPFLKKVVIQLQPGLSSYEKLVSTMKLFNVHRAAIAEIDIC